MYTNQRNNDRCFVRSNWICIKPDDMEISNLYENPKSGSEVSKTRGFVNKKIIREALRNKDCEELPRVFLQTNYYDLIEFDGVFIAKNLNFSDEFFIIHNENGPIRLDSFLGDQETLVILKIKSWYIPINYLDTEEGKSQAYVDPIISDKIEKNRIPVVFDELFDNCDKFNGLHEFITNKNFANFCILLFFNGVCINTMKEEVKEYFERSEKYKKYQDFFHVIWFPGDLQIRKLRMEIKDLHEKQKEDKKMIEEHDQKLKEVIQDRDNWKQKYDKMIEEHDQKIKELDNEIKELQNQIMSLENS